MDDKINIVFATDDNYAQHVAVAMVSILLNTKDPNRIKFYIIDDEISEININMITKTVTNHGGGIAFVRVKNENLKNCYVSGELSRAIYYRLDIANILPEEVRKVIYLDADLLVYSDITELWEFDMGGCPVAAVPDLGIMASARLVAQKEKLVGIPKGSDYFNSGVLLLDLDRWRKNNFAKKVIELASNNKYPNHDQDVLNLFFLEQWKVIPQKWNVIPPIFNLFLKVLKNKKYREMAITAKKNPAIFHYAGGYKPWEYEVHAGFNDIYYKLLDKTEYKNAVMPQMDRRRKNRSIMRQLLRLKIADFWCKIF